MYGLHGFSSILQVISKCVKMNYCKLLMQSLLANMEAAPSFTTQLAKSISVLDAVIRIAEAAEQMSLQAVHKYFQKAGFSTESMDDKIDESNIQELQESLNQAMYENVKAEDYLNIDNGA
jgi:hypothetical protein